LKRILAFCFSLLCLIFIWQSIATKISSDLILPLPLDVLVQGRNLLQNPKFLAAFKATSFRCIFSFSLVLSVGGVCGVLSALFPVFSTVLSPFLALIRAVPVISVLLLALFWLKSDAVGVFVAFLMAFPIMTTAVKSGFEAQIKVLNEMATCYKISAFERLCFIRFPAAFPAVKTGFTSTAGMIWKLVAAGEVLSLPRIALGSFLQNAQVVLETADVFAITAIIVFASFIFCACVDFLLWLSVLFARAFKKKYFSYSQRLNKVSIASFDSTIKIENFSFKYENNEQLYDSFNLEISPHDVVAVLASSGCGKTTLLNYVASKEIARGKTVAYLFQESRLLPSLTVRENIALPLLHKEKSPLAVASNALDWVGLSGKENAMISELSGGERQRVAIARAFAYKADVMLLDEPFQSQDFVGKMKLISLFCAVHSETKSSTLIVTHDPKEAALLGQRIVVLKGKPVQVVSDFTKNGESAEKIEAKIIKSLMS